MIENIKNFALQRVNYGLLTFFSSYLIIKSKYCSHAGVIH